MPHNYFLDAKDMKPLAIGFGSGIASDRITVDGSIVGYCYREAPDSRTDSGWRFFAGDETQEYADNAGNFALYDLNTIANYDPSITSILEAPVGSCFERNPSGDLVPVANNEA